MAADAVAQGKENRKEIAFAVRLVTIEYEMRIPVPSFDPVSSPLTGDKLQRVPVVCIFGSTPRGQRTCVHVHGAFRSLLVPYDGPIDAGDEQRSWLCNLASDLTAEINASAERRGGGGDDGDGGGWRNVVRVFDMAVEQRLPFYGYHAEPRPFVRVYVVDPDDVPAAASAFYRGLNRRGALQPYQAEPDRLEVT